jgi:hypothetical protein
VDLSLWQITSPPASFSLSNEADAEVLGFQDSCEAQKNRDTKVLTRYISFCLFLVFLTVLGFELRTFRFARQPLYHLIHSASPVSSRISL